VVRRFNAAAALGIKDAVLIPNPAGAFSAVRGLVNPGKGWGLRGAWGGQPIQGSTLVTLPTALCSFYATNSASPKRNPATEGGVCTENSVRVDYVSESPNVSDDDRSVLPLPGPVRLAIQVEKPT